MDQEDRDRLIKIETDVSWLRTGFTAHLSEHTKIRLLFFGSVIASLTALAIALV